MFYLSLRISRSPRPCPDFIRTDQIFGFFHTAWSQQQMWHQHSYILLQSNGFIKTVSAKIVSDFDSDKLDLLRSDPLDNFALLYTIVECSRGRDPHFSATSHTSSHKNVSHFTPAEIFHNTKFRSIDSIDRSLRLLDFWEQSKNYLNRLIGAHQCK